jgi:hypothetical protein
MMTTVRAVGSILLGAALASRVAAQGTPDSATAPGRADSIRQSEAAARAAALKAMSVMPPSDTVLAKACAGMPAGAEAPGLLSVVFRAGTSDTAKASAMRAVGGALAGSTRYGEEYVRVSSGPLPVVADRLIHEDPVTTVSSVRCPAAAPQPGIGAPGPAGASPAPAAPQPTPSDSAAPRPTASDSSARDSASGQAPARGP